MPLVGIVCNFLPINNHLSPLPIFWRGEKIKHHKQKGGSLTEPSLFLSKNLFYYLTPISFLTFSILTSEI